MRKRIYLEPLKSAPGRSILYYSYAKANRRLHGKLFVPLLMWLLKKN